MFFRIFFYISMKIIGNSINAANSILIFFVYISIIFFCFFISCISIFYRNCNFSRFIFETFPDVVKRFVMKYLECDMEIFKIAMCLSKLIASLISLWHGLFVCWMIGWSVCHNFLMGREVTLSCSYWSACLKECTVHMDFA